MSRSHTLRELTIDQQRRTSRSRISALQRQQTQAFRKAVEPETRPADQTVFLEGVVVHHFDPVKKELSARIAPPGKKDGLLGRNGNEREIRAVCAVKAADAIRDVEAEAPPDLGRGQPLRVPRSSVKIQEFGLPGRLLCSAWRLHLQQSRNNNAAGSLPACAVKIYHSRADG